MGVVLALPVGLAVLGFVAVVAVCVYLGACAAATGLAACVAEQAKVFARRVPILRDMLPAPPTAEEIEARRRQEQLDAEIEAEIAVARLESEQRPKTLQEAQARVSDAREDVEQLDAELHAKEALAKQNGIGWAAVAQLREDCSAAKEQVASAENDLERWFGNQQFGETRLVNVSGAEVQQRASEIEEGGLSELGSQVGTRGKVVLDSASDWRGTRHFSSSSDNACRLMPAKQRSFVTSRTVPGFNSAARQTFKVSTFSLSSVGISRRAAMFLKTIPRL